MRAIGILLVLISIPVFIALLKSNPPQRKWAYFAVGILPFVSSALNLDAALISWAYWPGHSKGIVVSLLDTLALAIVVTSRKPFLRLPFLGLLIAYVLAAALSIAFSDAWMSSAFYVFQLLRVLIVFVAVASFAGQPGAIRWLAFGLAAGAIFQAAVTIEQSLSGAVQASGTMGHQNLLGLMLHFVTLPLLALLLAGEKNKIIMLGVLGGLIAVALGASRGTVGFVTIGIVLLVMLSLARRPTPHKWKIVGLGVLASILVVPLAMESFAERFEARPVYEGAYDERAAFERGASAMWADNPMGVGANQFVVTANAGGYYARAGVAWSGTSRSAPVHNMYLLAAAETGWVGLLVLIALVAWPVVRGLAFAFRHRRDPRGDMVLGASGAILATALHGFYEWIFLNVGPQYVFAISLGIIAASVRQVRHEKSVRQMRMRQQAMQRPSLQGLSETEEIGAKLRWAGHEK